MTDLEVIELIRAYLDMKKKNEELENVIKEIIRMAQDERQI